MDQHILEICHYVDAAYHVTTESHLFSNSLRTLERNPSPSNSVYMQQLSSRIVMMYVSRHVSRQNSPRIVFSVQKKSVAHSIK